MKSLRALFLILFLLLATNCTRHGSDGEPSMVHRLNDTTLRIDPPAMKNVTVTPVKMDELPEKLDLMGRISVTEDRTTMIPARVAGRIDAIYLNSGESVKNGQPLLSLFSPDFVSAREEYLQALKQKRALDTGDASDFGNFSELAKKKLETMGLSPADVDSLPQGDAHNNPDLIVRSPRSGVIIDKKAVLGNLVNVGDSLFTVADISKVWFSGDLYAEDLPRVHKEQEVMIEDLPGGESLGGKISFISPIVDPTAHTIKIRALMDNPKGMLRADMYVHGAIILSKKMALLIPTTSVIRDGSEDFVYRRVGENTFERIPIQTKEEFKNLSAVTQGLKEGDDVISDGGLFLEAALSSSGN